MKAAFLILQFFVTFLSCCNLSAECKGQASSDSTTVTVSISSDSMPFKNVSSSTICPLLSRRMLSDPPWHPDIPDVINPDLKDLPPKFIATIATKLDRPICSAAIVSLHFLVSSCLKCLQRNKKPVANSEINVMIGNFDNDLGLNGATMIIYEVERVVLHPGCFYTGGKYLLKYDIGLIKTINEIRFSAFIGAADIPHVVNSKLLKNLVLSTFRTKNTAATSPKDSIWFVKVQKLNSIFCQKVLNSSFYSLDNYCTPYHHIEADNDDDDDEEEEEELDECLSDYGAPLSAGDYLIGLLIHKFGCGKTGSAASFVKVFKHRFWLARTIQKLSEFRESV